MAFWRNIDTEFHYDGSFSGCATVLFHCFEERVVPSHIVPQQMGQKHILPSFYLATDLEKSKRVLQSFPRRLGREASAYIHTAFLSGEPDVELDILQFLRQAYPVGPSALDRSDWPAVCSLQERIRRVGRECEKWVGFLRFSLLGDAMLAQFRPKADLLCLLQPHFSQRFPNSPYLIHDATRNKLLLAEGPHIRFLPAPVDFVFPRADAKEKEARALWKQFLASVSIRDRENPDLQRQHMPFWYRRYMPEYSWIYELEGTPRADSPSLANSE